MDEKSKVSQGHDKLHKTIIDNHVALQRKNIELIESVNNLSKRIDKLVGIFEEASKHVLEVGEDKRIIELADKLEELLDQNRSIAKGLLMLESYVKTKTQFERQM